MQYLSAQNKGLLAQLNEAKRRQAEIECKVNNILKNTCVLKYVHFSFVCHCWIKLSSLRSINHKTKILFTDFDNTILIEVLTELLLCGPTKINIYFKA